MASSKKTYDTDSIVLRRILALNPLTNGRISANTVLVTGANGAGSFRDTVGFLSTLGVPTSITSLGQIYNSTILVPGTNITFSSNANQITINGGSGIAAADLTSTTMGLGSLGYLSTTQLASTIVNLGQIYNSTILVAGTNITFSSNVNQITINGQAGGIAATDLTSTTMGLGSLGYLSTQQLTSSLRGLGSLGYLSTSQLASTIVNLGQIYNSTILVAGTNITFSSNVNQITINGQAGGGGGDVTALNLTSTTMGLGSLGYLSTTQLASTIVNLGQIYNSTILVAGTNITFSSNVNQITINGQAGGGGLSVTDLTSTTMGLGILGYLSSFNTISSANLSSGSVYASLLSSQQITASSIKANNFVGDGSLITNVPNSGVTSITAGTGIGVNTTTGSVTVSNSGVVSITQGDGISITGSDGSFTITATGGTAGTVAAADLVSTVIGIQLRATSSLTSSLQGLSYMGYLSSFATISSLNISTGSIYASLLSSQRIMASSMTANKFIGDGSLLVNVPGTGGLATIDLTSTVTGLGTSGYLSSLTLLSTIKNLGQIYNSTILIAGTNITFSSNINQITINGQAGGGGLAASDLTSTTMGLGSISYISSFNTLSSLNISSGSIYTSTTSTTETNAGRLNFGELYNNGTKLVDAYGNILFSFQTL